MVDLQKRENKRAAGGATMSVGSGALRKKGDKESPCLSDLCSQRCRLVPQRPSYDYSPLSLAPPTPHDQRFTLWWLSTFTS